MTVSTLKLIEVSGEPYERGRAYGEQAAPEIRRARDRLIASWGVSEHELDEWTDPFAHTIESVTPDLAEEIRGIAEASGCSVRQIVAINSRNEISYARRRSDTEGCTVLAACPPATDGSVLLAQNWDADVTHVEDRLTIHIDMPDGPSLVTFVDAGRLAMHGLNTSGVGVCGNSLYADGPVNKQGLPISLIRRKLLESNSTQAALDFIHNVPRATSSNYMIADRNGVIVDVEATATDLYTCTPVDGVLVHTNHFQWASGPVESTTVDRYFGSVRRLERAEALLAQRTGAVDHALMQAVLCDHAPEAEQGPDGSGSICAHSHPRRTLASHLIDVTRGSMRIANGYPCKTEYVAVPLGESKKVTAD
jgi:isopenicillin-N N-acyltransferase-like protein